MWDWPVRLRRGIAAALATLYAFGALAALAHVATVEHVRCPEHGDLVHAASAHLGADAPPPASAYSAQERLRRGDLATEHADHEHCGVLARHAPEGASAPVTAASRALTTAVLWAPVTPGEEAVCHGQPGYRLAPKQGPPRA